MCLEFRSTTIVLLIGIGIGVLPAIAIDRDGMGFDWHFKPEDTQAHPKKLQMAYVVTESMEIVACNFSEHLIRVGGGEAEPPIPTVAGKLIVALKIVKTSGTLKVGKQTQTADDFLWGSAHVGWTDGSGYVCEGCPDNLRHKRTDKLPVRVEPGDVILWSLRFKGMPPLQVEPTAQVPYSDEIQFSSGCESCGSVGYPCPDPW